MNPQLLLTGTTSKQQPHDSSRPSTQQQQDVDCVQTKVWMWEGEQYQQFQSEFLNQIYPYKLNKKTVTPNSKFIFHFLTSSLHYWIQLNYQGEQEVDKLGKKDSKVIQEILNTDQTDNWIAFRRWGEYYDKREQWLKHQEQQPTYKQPQGQLMHTYKRGQDEFQIVKYMGDNKQFIEYKKRIQVLMLFYIDGVSFVLEQCDFWIYYVIYCKKPNHKNKQFVGVLSQYVFRLSAFKERHRISQVLVLPAYQKAGHGKEILDLVYRLSLQNSNCFEITTEIPSFQYQCLRDFKQLQLLITYKLFRNLPQGPMRNRAQIQKLRSLLLTKQLVRQIKQDLKIPGHQIQRLANIMLYSRLDDQMGRAHFQQELRQKIITNRSPFRTRKCLPHITFFGQVPVLKQFFLQKAREDMMRNQTEVQEILTQTLDGYRRVIAKLQRVGLIGNQQ